MSPRNLIQRYAVALVALVILGATPQAHAQKSKKKARPAKVEPEFPPTLPDGKQVITDNSPEFLKPPETLREGVTIAKTAPTVDFLFYPGQDYPGAPWSNWGDSSAANGKYYSAIGDHYAIGRGESEHGTGSGRVFEYDPATKKLRLLCNTTEILKMPKGHYTPGKIHSRLDMGSDGWLYFATHRGSTKVTTDEYHYEGDWIFRTNPETDKSEVVVRGPVPKHCIPNSVLDPDRLIFYGGTAAGVGKDINFFAYDVKNKKLLYSGPDGPARYMMFARSTGKLYYVPGNKEGPLMRFDPAGDHVPVKVGVEIGIRAATNETPQGLIYTVGLGQGAGDAQIYSFNTKTEEVKEIGTVAAASQAYVASIDADPTGRFLYYIPGAHGSSNKDGAAVIQFDVQTAKKKVIAFLEPFYTDHYKFTLKGTYATAVDPAGDKLYVTWNVSRGTKAWDCCGLTVIHIPESERAP